MEENRKELVLVEREVFFLIPMPLLFRTMKDILDPEKHGDIEMDGVAMMHASGSGSFTTENFDRAMSYLRVVGASDIVIIDLRKESHCYINRLPYLWFSDPVDGRYDWYNDGKTSAQIIEDEKKLVATLREQGKIHIFGVTPCVNSHEQLNRACEKKITVTTALTEQDLVTQENITYIRLPVSDHHSPTIDIIDQFIQVVMTHKKNWLHIHCMGGKGRTTTFLALLDMMHNSKKIDFEMIVKRQCALGHDAKNLLNPAGEHVWEIPVAQDRLEMLKKFYRYCKENNDHFATLFSVWLKKNGL